MGMQICEDCEFPRMQYIGICSALFVISYISSSTNWPGSQRPSWPLPLVSIYCRPKTSRIYTIEAFTLVNSIDCLSTAVQHITSMP